MKIKTISIVGGLAIGALVLLVAFVTNLFLPTRTLVPFSIQSVSAEYDPNAPLGSLNNPIQIPTPQISRFVDVPVVELFDIDISVVGFSEDLDNSFDNSLENRCPTIVQQWIPLDSEGEFIDGIDFQIEGHTFFIIYNDDIAGEVVIAAFPIAEIYSWNECPLLLNHPQSHPHFYPSGTLCIPEPFIELVSNYGYQNANADNFVDSDNTGCFTYVDNTQENPENLQYLIDIENILSGEFDEENDTCPQNHFPYVVGEEFRVNQAKGYEGDLVYIFDNGRNLHRTDIAEFEYFLYEVLETQCFAGQYFVLTDTHMGELWIFGHQTQLEQ